MADKMIIAVADDPAEIGIDRANNVCRILRGDYENAKAFAREVVTEKNPVVRRKWEKAFHDEMKELYGGSIAGALMLKVWDWTKEDEEEDA